MWLPYTQMLKTYPVKLVDSVFLCKIPATKEKQVNNLTIIYYIIFLILKENSSNV